MEGVTPFEQAALWHAKHCPGSAFAEVVEAHFQTGYVVGTPEVFLLGRRIDRTWPDEWVNDPWRAAPDGDCWHVWLWAGTVRDWSAMVPYPLPWLSWHRGEKRRVFRFPAGK